MYASLDLVCRLLSTLANKSATFLTEQKKKNVGYIKESTKNVCSQGVNLQVTVTVWYSLVDMAVEKNSYQAV